MCLCTLMTLALLAIPLVIAGWYLLSYVRAGAALLRADEYRDESVFSG